MLVLILINTFQEKTKKKITRDLVATILKRKSKMCSFIEWQDMKIVYKRYASLYFCAAIDVSQIIFKQICNFSVLQSIDNELVTLEVVHRYVELLDKYFGSVSYISESNQPIKSYETLQVCELDIIFNYEKAYFMLDELLLAGEIQETSKKNVLKATVIVINVVDYQNYIFSFDTRAPDYDTLTLG